MFQKELGEKILGKFQSENYGRLSILTSYRLKFVDKFSVSSNCFNPKPKVTSLVIHFKPKIDRVQKIKDINNLEKVTNILFSNKRKMINKNIKKLISEDQIKNLPNINLNLRPADIHPNMYYKITEILEKK